LRPRWFCPARLQKPDIWSTVADFFAAAGVGEKAGLLHIRLKRRFSFDGLF